MEKIKSFNYTTLDKELRSFDSTNLKSKEKHTARLTMNQPTVFASKFKANM